MHGRLRRRGGGGCHAWARLRCSFGHHGGKDAEYDEEPGGEDSDDVDEELDGSEHPPGKRARLDIASPASQSWLGASEHIEALLPGILKGIIGHSLQSALGVEGFAKVGVIVWEGWGFLTQELMLLGTNEVLNDEMFFEHSQNAVSKSLCAFLRIAADNVHDIPVVTDTVAKARYQDQGFSFGNGLVHGQNDCLSDSLLQCLSAAGVLSDSFTSPDHVQRRAAACAAVRQHLLIHDDARLRPMPWNSFLEEHLHGPHIVRFFLEYFSEELLLVPATIQLVTHSRFDRGVQDPGTESVIDPATTHVELIPPEQDEQWDLDLHLYNDTGFGARGLHFSPVLRMLLPTFE